MPVSSSGHIALLGHLINIETNLSLVALLHFGTLFSVLIFTLKAVLRIFKNPKLILMLALSTIPAGLVGIFFDEIVEQAFQTTKYLPIFFCITSVLLLVASKIDGNKSIEQMTLTDSLVIGFFQAAAILPGISRSGATIAAALILGFDKKDALEYSFLLSIPIIAGAGLMKINGLSLHGFHLFLVAFIVGTLSLFVLRKLVLTKKLNIFAFYCLAIAILTYFVR